MRIKLFSISVFFIILLLHSSAQTRELVKVCILPFEQYSLEKDKLLHESVVHELEKQLSLNPYFIVCQSSQVQQVLSELGLESFTENNLSKISKHLGANFLVLGSITKIMDEMSLDIEVFNDFHPVKYFKTFADGTDLRRLVDDTSKNIVQDIMRKESFIPPSKRAQGEIKDTIPDDSDIDLDYYLDTLLNGDETSVTDKPISPIPTPVPLQQEIEETVLEEEIIKKEDSVEETAVVAVPVAEEIKDDIVHHEKDKIKPVFEPVHDVAVIDAEPETEEDKPLPVVKEETAYAAEEPVKPVIEKKTEKKKEKDRMDFASSGQPINISADTLEYDNKANRASFTGNVVARQGNMVIFAKKMEVVYSTDGGIDEAKATGNVRVVQGDRIATGDTIVFNNRQQKIVATGNARVWQGDNVIQGRTISVYLREDRAVVEGGPEGRVSATIVPGKDKE